MSLVIADIALTTKILAGGGSETWLSMKKIMDAVGRGWGPVKYGASAVAVFMWLAKDAVAALVVAICVMALIVAHNAREYRKVKLRGW